MCFSETASYAVGAACVCAGLYSAAKCPSPTYLPLAVIPFVFGIHQITEGLVWHAMNADPGASARGIAPMLFAFIATVFWPVFVPFAVFSTEQDGARKKLLALLVGIGALVSLAYFVRLLNADISAGVSGHSVVYTSRLSETSALPPWLYSGAQGGSDWLLVPYAASTIGSLALARLQAVRLFAFFVALALVFLMLISQATLVSVWCFFAASGSLMILPAILEARLKSGPALNLVRPGAG